MSAVVSPYDLQAFEQVRRQLRIDPLVVRRFRTDLLKHYLSDEAVLRHLPEPDRVALHSLELYRRCDSNLDGASKLLFRTAAGMLIESVILRVASGRTTLCLSSQVGCAAACDFCATGRMGIARNLSVEEILDQVLQTGQLLKAEGRRLRNIVFMGMGEPFHNEANLFTALERLTAVEFFHHPATKILVSTVGVADAMVRCVERFPAVNLALSLHSVRQEIREQLIPLARKFPLEQLREAIREVNDRSPAPVMIEYLMLAGVNDSESDARALIAWVDGLRVHINLIPFNAIDDAPHLTGSDVETRKAFAEVLKTNGLKTTIRYSLGSDIAAACGQLVRRENREHARLLVELQP
jgi:23S rRNA (adenine2503-C2)-methyltransferase